MKILHRPLLVISFSFFCLSILNPLHNLPWVGFFSEFSAFLGMLLLIPILFNCNILIPKISLFFVLVAIFPLTQYAFGQVFYLSNAGLSTIYLLSFWLMIVVGYNLSIPDQKDSADFNILYFLAYFFLIVSLISSIFCIVQWLNLANNFSFIMQLIGNRPYANMAQPNHLATFLSVGCLSSWYLFEKNKIKKIIASVFCIFLMFAIVLTQSRSAWLIIIFCIGFIIFQSKYFKLKLSAKKLIIWLVFFLILILILPILNNILVNYFNLININTAIERATTGYTRFTIWNQMLHALIQKPWFGYGWNQTTAAQFLVIDQYHGNEWATSAHNLFLDIFIWCGLPLGLFIVSFIIYFYRILIKNIINLDKLFAILVISAIGIHSLFEYPLYYSYFILPFGLFCGAALQGYGRVFRIESIFIIGIFSISILSSIAIFKEYMKVDDNLFAGRLHAMGDLRTEVDLPHHLFFLDNFRDRSIWLGLYPKMNVSKDKIMTAQHIVQTSLKPYDIHKYAQLLANNGNKLEAIRQLKILYIMYGIDIAYSELLEKKQKI